MSWFRAIAAADKPLHGVSVLKGAAAPVASPVVASKPHVDLKNMCVTAVLTTRSPDRQGDIVDPNGGDFGEHRVNPVVLFHHGKDHRLPIGKAEDPDGNYTVRLVKAVDGELLLGTTFFSQNNRFAQDVFGLVAEDILRGVSIGFDPQSESDSVEEIGPSPVLERPALHFKAWKLLEYSHTPIGVNRDALTVAVHKSLDGSRKLHPALERALLPLAQPRKTVVSTAAPAVTKGDNCAAMPKKQKVAIELDKARKAGKKIPPPVGKGIEDDAYQVFDDTMTGIENTGKDIAHGVKTVGRAVATGDKKVAGPFKKKPKPATTPKPPAPGGVTKAMDYDNDGDDDTTAAGGADQDYGSDVSGGDDQGGYNPATDDPNSDPNLPANMTGNQGEEAPPTVAALLDGAQGVMDLCSQLEASVKKGEHPEGRKFAAAICGKLRALAGKMKSKADGIHSELNGADYGSDADQNGDEDSGEASEPPEGGEDDEGDDETGPETDDDGALVTKGYRPSRFVIAGSGVAPVVRPGAVTQWKALQRENAELKEALERVLTDVEAGRNRDR